MKGWKGSYAIIGFVKVDLSKEEIAATHKMSLDGRLFKRNTKVMNQEMVALYGLGETKTKARLGIS